LSPPKSVSSGADALDASPSNRAAIRKLDAVSIIETPSNRKTNA
jgi:hypothetical protein